MKIIQLDRDTKNFRRHIAHLAGESAELAMWGNRLLESARAAYLAYRDTGHMAASVKMHRVQSREGINVDYEIYVDDKGASKMEWGHWSGTRKTPWAYRRWVQGRHVLRNALPGGKREWVRRAKNSKKNRAKRDAADKAAGRRIPARRTRRRR